MEGVINNYYVYLHLDPRTREVRYVGMGQGSRAWMMRNSGGKSSKYGHRCQAHWEWFKELEYLHYTLEDIVQIVRKGLNKEDAKKFEKEQVALWGIENLFNADMSAVLRRYDHKEEEMKQLRMEGKSYAEIGKIVGCSAMTARRYTYE